jgi:hypothetical protein
MNEGLRARLRAMAAPDERLRAELVRDGTRFDGYNPRMAELQGVHRRRAEVGLPPIEKQQQRIRLQVAAECEPPPPDYTSRQRGRSGWDG